MTKLWAWFTQRTLCLQPNLGVFCCAYIWSQGQAHFWTGIRSLLGNISPCFRGDHCRSYTIRVKGMAFKYFSVGLHFLTSAHWQNCSIFIKRISTRSPILKLGWKRADSYTTVETCHWICSWRGSETEPFSWEAWESIMKITRGCSWTQALKYRSHFLPKSQHNACDSNMHIVTHPWCLRLHNF